MVEETKRSMREHHIVLVRSLNTLRVHHTPARRCEILDAAPACTMHIVREREERITRARDAVELLRMGGTLLLR